MLDIRDLTLSYGDNTVLHNVSLSLAQGEIGCVLGPSGCGKTTLLRAIAGFKKPESGCITIGEQTVCDELVNIEVAERKVGVIFQDFALFPHLNVEKNIAYGLQKISRQERKALTDSAMALVDLQDYAHKYPHELSGGQQQRVAIARALAPKPDLLLLDEAFSSLDPELRERLSGEIRSLLKEQNITALLITHDQTEAFAMADKIAVLQDHVCHQWDTAYALYHEPATEFVAKFIGEGTFIEGTIRQENQQLIINTHLGSFPLEPSKPLAEGIKGKLLVRPDDLRHQDESLLKAQVVGRSFRGAHIMYRLQLENSNETLLCLAPSHHDHAVGERFGIHLEIEHVICFA